VFSTIDDFRKIIIMYDLEEYFGIEKYFGICKKKL